MTNTENDTREQASNAATAAAQWWAKAVGAPVFDNGDALSSMLGTVLSARHAAPTRDQSGDFVTELARRIDADLERFRSFDGTVTLGVDYGPDPVLADAARAVGISTGRFPWKTMMWVREDHVTVSAGYGAPSVLVWASEEWLANRPACDTQQYDEAKARADFRTYGGEPWACSLPKYHEGQHQYDAPLVLCARCGRTDGWYHNADERGHMPNFHEFEAATR